jgi:gamma-glutamylcysteine synthetase
MYTLQQYSTCDCDCDYYTECAFNEIIQNNLAFSAENLSLIHLNIRSLGRNLNSLTNLLVSINHKFSVIGISETWLEDSLHNVDIVGYNFVHDYRSDRSGGGILAYI